MPPSEGKNPTRDCVFDPAFLDDLHYFIDKERKLALRTLDLVEAIRRDPFVGVGKPEPLKHLHAGAWSRRLTDEHRLIYVVEDDRITFIQARYHYGR